MAGLDKTYVSSWKEYQEVIEWMSNKEFACPNGMILRPIDYCYTWKESDFKDSEILPVMNTPEALDYFLAKECPLKVIQERLSELSLSIEVTDRIPAGKIKFLGNPKEPRKPYRFYVCVSGDYWYNEDYDMFINPFTELGVYTSNMATLECKSLKSMIRKIKSWNLPGGHTVDIFGGNQSWKIYITSAKF